MSNNKVLEYMQPAEYLDKNKVIAIADRKLNQKWIKQRKGGGNVILKYVEGHRIIRLLREATDNTFSTIIHNYFIQESIPKQLVEWNNTTRAREPVFQKLCINCQKPFNYLKGYNTKIAKCPYCEFTNDITLGQQGEAVTEPQPPVAHVLLELIIPGLGTNMAMGAKTVIGGASEQESIFKAAATDALKKAATLFGFGLEMMDDEEELALRSIETGYEEKEEEPVDTSYNTLDPVPNLVPEVPPMPAQNNAPQTQQVNQNIQQQPMQQQNAAPIQNNNQVNNVQSNNNGAKIMGYNPKDTEKMREIKNFLGIDAGPEGNPKLNPYVLEFSQQNTKFGTLTSFTNLTPEVLPHFNSFMEQTYLNQ